MDESLAYLIGALRDGSIFYDSASRNYKIIWYQKVLSWLENSIAPRVEAVFERKPRIEQYKPGHFRLLLSSKQIHDMFIEEYGFVSPQELWETPVKIRNANDKIIASYVAGFFDAEGDVNVKDYVAGFSQKNRESLVFIRNWLNKKGVTTGAIFDADKKSGTLRFFITSKNNFKKFRKLVPFEHPDKIIKLDFLIQ